MPVKYILNNLKRTIQYFLHNANITARLESFMYITKICKLIKTLHTIFIIFSVNTVIKTDEYEIIFVAYS